MPLKVSAVSRARDLWAKSSKEGRGHTLLAHLLDVGIVARCLLAETRLQPAIALFAADLGLEASAARRLLLVLAALHDIGKASPSFQRKWPEGAPPEALVRPVDDMPHGTISAFVIKEWLRELGMHRKEAETLANAVGVHHGHTLPAGFDRALSVELPAIGSTPWSGWREELIGEVVSAFGPLPEFERRKGYRSASSWVFLAGLTSVADWIGSGLPHTEPVGDVAAYVAERDAAVRDRFREIAWPTGERWWVAPEEPHRFASWFRGTPAGANPRPLQLAVEEALAELGGEPGLVVLEAPMGEGKTEAAFFAAVRSASPGGTYIGMPTQATSDAMHARLHDFVARHRRRNVGISLAHGSARSLAQLRSATGVDVAPSLPPEADQALEPADREGMEAAATQVQWFSMGRKELLAELGVGTADQALQGVLPTRHHFVKLWALAGKVVVLDEVHAFEEYTTGLVEELVRWLATLGCTVVVMSATLPGSTRRALVAAYRDGVGEPEATIEDTTYPRLTISSATLVRSRSFSASRSSRVRIAAAPFAPGPLLEFIRQLTAGGGAVGVIVNTVDRAQELYELCRREGLEPSLLHARMPLAERKAREAELLRRYGPESSGRREGLVIATQVVEQSLDVDFDVLVTDLAPVDLILQRTGRQHRHAHHADRGSHVDPVLHIAGLGDVATGPEEEATDSVYDAYLMWRSWAVLVDARELVLPSDIDALVQAVYDTDRPLSHLERYAEKMTQLAHRLRTRTQVERGEADAWLAARPADPAPEAWKVTATDAEERVPGKAVARTRLGERSVAAVPVYQTSSGWRLPNDAGGLVSPSGRVPRSWLLAALMCQLSVRNKRLIAQLDAVKKPSWWERQKLLRFLTPLMLSEDGTALVDARVRLDAELGLVISHGRT